MPMRLAIARLALGFALIGCAGASDDGASAARTERTEIVPAGDTPEATEAQALAPAPATTEARSFQLEWQRGTGAVLRDQISVRGDGRVVWVTGSQPGQPSSMRALTFEATDDEVRRVREAVDAAGFFALPAETTSQISDGEQLSLRVRHGERSHQVRIEEPFPPGIERVVVAVDAILTPPRRAALAHAPLARPEDFDSSLVE